MVRERSPSLASQSLFLENMDNLIFYDYKSLHEIISNVIISIDLKWMRVGVITLASASIFYRAR